MRVKSFAVAALTILGAVGVAGAADMRPPVYKAPMMAPVSVYNWGGFYAGGHLGGGWSDLTAYDYAVPNPAATGQPDLGFNNDGSSIVGGLQAGYNWHFAPNWVAGLEVDATWTDLGGSQTYTPVPQLGPPVAGSTETLSRDIDWLVTVRGRLGYAWDRWLAYVTGGVAFADINYNAVSIFPGLVFGFNDSVKTGWTLGAGFEYGFSDYWTVRAEYLYYNFDGATGISYGTPSTFPLGSRYVWDDADIHTVRVGINYRFGPR